MAILWKADNEMKLAANLHILILHYLRDEEHRWVVPAEAVHLYSFFIQYETSPFFAVDL